MDDRGQEILIANYYHQDFIFPGYTIEGGAVYNHDPASTEYDTNGFLVRPDPVGVAQPHTVDVCYLGLGGDGHIGRINVTNQSYWAFGHDTLNPLANQPEVINAWMHACELSYDRDWVRFRISAFYSSGDHNIKNGEATGFDSIMDNPVFAGSQFSYWGTQQQKLFGVNLVQANSLIPDLRSSKIQGQSNFVNPGLIQLGTGVDIELTPKLKMVNSINWLWFDSAAVLEQYTYDFNISDHIGTDISSGFEYRPLLSNNVVMRFGVSTLIPGGGYKALFAAENPGNTTSTVNPPVAAFVQFDLTY